MKDEVKFILDQSGDWSQQFVLEVDFNPGELMKSNLAAVYLLINLFLCFCFHFFNILAANNFLLP